MLRRRSTAESGPPVSNLIPVFFAQLWSLGASQKANNIDH